MLVSCWREQGMDNILYVLERADKFVYHYTKPQSLAKFLPTGHIRFSRFTCTNDPRECNDWKLGLWTPEGCKDVTYQNHSQVPSLSVDDPLILNGDDVRLLGVSPAIHKHLTRYHREIFFQKPRDWADERELRWLLHLLSDDELYVPFGDSLAGIVITPDFPPEYRRAIANYADAHPIEIGELRWSNFSPEMVPSTLACVRAARA